VPEPVDPSLARFRSVGLHRLGHCLCSRYAVERRLALLLALVCWSVAAPAAAQPSPLAPFCPPGQTPALGARFTPLAALLVDTIGQPVECEHAELATGDIHQLSTAGLLYYRASTGSASFTDGFAHWALAGGNLAIWLGGGPDPSDATVELPAEPGVLVRGPASELLPDVPPP